MKPGSAEHKSEFVEIAGHAGLEPDRSWSQA